MLLRNQSLCFTFIATMVILYTRSLPGLRTCSGHVLCFAGMKPECIFLCLAFYEKNHGVLALYGKKIQWFPASGLH